MQVNSQKRENTQTTILALLLSHKGGCTLRQLDRDYNELEGEHIPWKDFGYVSLLNFLHSMSKTVRLESRNNITLVKGIASDKSKHVSKLVAGQKDYKPPIGRKVYKPNHYYPKTGPVRIHISAELLTRIVSLIDNHPDGLHKDRVLAKVQSRMPFVNITMKDMEEQLQELSHQIFQRNNKFYSVHYKDINFDRLTKSGGISGSEFDSCKNQNCKASIMTVAGEEDANDMLNYDEEDSFEFLPHSNVSMSLDEQLNTRTKSMSSFIKETVSKCQDEPLESTLMAQINQNGSRSLLVSNCNARNQIAMEDNNNTKVGKENYLETENVEILINKRVKFRLEKLIQNNPDGIWCADLPEKYMEEYKVPLNYIELGFNSVREFAAQLPQIFHCIQPYDTGDFKLYYAKEGIPANRLEQEKKPVNLTQMYHIYEANNEEALPATVSLDTCKELIPDDVMTLGECVGYLNVEDFIQGDEPYVEVLVVEVFTPSFFWVQFRRKEKLFNKFMDDLHNFYTVRHQQYVVPPVVLERGLNCACIYNGLWHRGIVKTVKPDFHVTVMFYDYGTLKTYPPEAVFYLHRIFSCLPAQAVPCGLVNVRPCNGSKWSRSATHHFAVRTSQVPLIATIASVNAEDNSMIISLTDTVEEEDVHINDWLVDQKLAEHGRMIDKVDMSNLLLYVEENLLFSPEVCYEEEVKVPSDDKIKSPLKSTNMPLITPQSTLDEKLLKPSPEFVSLNKEINCAKEEYTQKQTAEHKSESIMFTSHNSNTNPFLPDKHVYNQGESSISPQKFMQLWNENLQLQMQITKTLSMLLNKVVEDSAIGESSNLKNNGNILNSIRNALLLSNKQIPLSVDTINASSANICEGTVPPTTNAYSSTNAIRHTAFENTGYSAECSTFAAMNQQPLTATSYKNKESQRIVRKSQTPPGFDRHCNISTLDQQHCVTNNANTDLLVSANNPINNSITVKETNPFRLSLAGKLRIPNTQDENCLNLDDYTLQKSHIPIVEHDLISFENGNSNLKQTNRNTLNDFKGGSSSSNGISFNHNRTVNDVRKALSKIIIEDQPLQHLVHNKEMYCPSPLTNSLADRDIQIGEKRNKHERIGTSDFANINSSCTENTDFVAPQEKFSYKAANGNFAFVSNCDSNNGRSSTMLLSNSLKSPKLASNATLDGGYCTQSSNSGKMYTSSPIVQHITEPLCGQKSVAKNSADLNSECADTWSNSFKDTVQSRTYNKFNSVSESNGEQVKNSTVKYMLESHLKVDNLEIKNPYLEESEFKFARESTRVSQYSFSNYKVFLQVVELPEHIVHIFHYQREGWLLVDEFLTVFTEFKTAFSMLNLLHSLEVYVQFEEIDRAKTTLELVNRNSILQKPTQDIINGTSRLHLIQLKSALKVLHTLEIIKQKDTADVSVHRNYVYEISLVSNAYTQFMYILAQDQNECGQ